MIGGLQCCGQITTLELTSMELTSAHLNELLPRLPRLCSLSLRNAAVTTLVFLSQAPMTRQLLVFRLIGCRQLPLVELRNVHALRTLKELYLDGSFDTPMDALSQSLYTPPSLLRPQLKKFVYRL